MHFQICNNLKYVIKNSIKIKCWFLLFDALDFVTCKYIRLPMWFSTKMSLVQPTKKFVVHIPIFIILQKRKEKKKKISFKSMGI